MPVSPNLAAELAKALLAIYTDGEEQLLQRIAGNLAKGLNTPDWADRQLAAVQQIRRSTQAFLAKLNERGYKELSDAIRLAYNQGVALAGTDLVGAGTASAIAFGGIDPEAVEALISSQKDLRDSLAEGGLRIASGAAKDYRAVVEEVTGRMLTGAVTRKEAAAQAVAKWALRGVTKFTDKKGRNWDIGSYAEMATRTVAGHAMIQGHVDRLVSTGHQFVMVSDAPEECELCRPWEGKILSLGKETGRRTVNGHTFTVKGTLREAQRQGLFHPNCRHRTVVYIPGRTKPLHNTAAPEGDKLRQKQRAMERRVRELKRQVAALEPLGDSEALKKAKLKLRIYRGEFKSWREDNGRKDLSYRTSLTSR
jgi:hypothetical protein